MGPDPLQRILLALILAGVAVLIFQDLRRPVSRFEMGVVPGRQPALVRMDTATGRVEQLSMGGTGTWTPLGGEAPEGSGDGASLGAADSGELAAAQGPPEVAALGAALAAESPSQVRIWAAELLGNFPDTAAPRLIEALADPEPAVLLAASRSLAKSGQPDAVPALRELLEHADPDVRVGASEALATLE